MEQLQIAFNEREFYQREKNMIAMNLVKSSVKAWKTTAPRLALVTVMAVQSLGVGWAQEPVQPRIDEEFGKQEKIYRRRGAGSYTTNRGLSNYAELLPTGFCDALGRLGGSDRWLDIGAGEGQAILDYYAPRDDATSPENCGGSGPKARGVAISIEDRRTDRWKEQAASFGDDRLRYLSGKRLGQYSLEELGKFQIITDVYGGFTYTENLSRFVEKVLNLLEIGGAFYTVLSACTWRMARTNSALVSDRAGGCSEPSGNRVLLAEAEHLHKSHLRITERLGRAERADNHWQSLQRRDRPEHEGCGILAGAPPGRRFQLEP